MQPLAPFSRPETYKLFAFVLSGVVLGSVSVALLIAGWSLALGIAITPLVVPVLIGIGAITRALANAERALAKELLGVELEAPPTPRAHGFWGRGWAVLTDRAMWKEQAYLVLRFFISVVALAPLFWFVEALITPFTYRWGWPDYGFWQPDTLAEGLLPFAAGAVGLLLWIQLVSPTARLSQQLARTLLGGKGGRVRRPEAVRASRRRALVVHAVLTGGVSAVLVAVWALTPPDYFWPVWPLLALGLALGIHAWVVLVQERPHIPEQTGGSRGLATHIGISAEVGLFLAAVWAIATPGYFWPVWPLLGLAALVLFHAAVLFGRRKHRIEVLETSRAGAVGLHEAELRRIERDLHDGAQASLVALGMNLGMAEQKLQTDPAAAGALLAEARRGAREALEELRDLARGIHPPVLGDRGLEAAVAGLASRSPVHVTVAARLAERPPPACETAAYFVVAEAIANAGKHAEATRLDIRIVREGDVLAVEVVDDGRGGADPNGHGLTGLRQRVEALDGTLDVTSPIGGPTTVRARLPCAS